MDWTDWHKLYDAGMQLDARLSIVRKQIRVALENCTVGPIQIVSVCAGDGRDVMGALVDHPRREDVTAWFLDTDEASLSRGRAEAAQTGLGDRMKFLCADAAQASSYRGIVPADLVIVSGMLGHLSAASLPVLLENLRMLCRAGGGVIWNRHLVLNHGAEKAAFIRRKLQELPFAEVQYEETGEAGFAVGLCRNVGESLPLDEAKVLFDFVGLDKLLEEEKELAGGFHPIEFSAGFTPRVPESMETLATCFERQASATPQRIAIGSGSWQATYGELNQAANRVAYQILSGEDPLRKGERVALIMEHGGVLVMGMLAVLKAARVVIVLNASDPPARLQQVLVDADPAVIVTDGACRTMAEQVSNGGRVINAEEHLTGPSAPNPGIAASPDDLAFLIYTSGSTGPPKGVMQTHCSIRHRTLRMVPEFGITDDDHVTLLAALTGGQGVATAWSALSSGATLCPLPIMAEGVVRLPDLLRSHRISVFVASTSLLRHFVRTLKDETRFPTVRVVWLASESSTGEDVAACRKHFAPTCTVFHTLASSETGVISSLRLSHNDPIPSGILPVGRPLHGMEVLLSSKGGADPTRAGEIAIRSQYLALGYWRDESLTRKRFLGGDDPEHPRIFISGDRGRFTSEGVLEFMGRHDSRINVHGYRVELYEIEEALARQAGVEKAIVTLHERPHQEGQLCAFLTVHPGHSVHSRGLRAALRTILPTHMIPASYTVLDQFPLTAHGKVDREALRQLAPALAPQSATGLPMTETEQRLASIWADALGCGPVGPEDDFFELGGDSLKATVITAKIHVAFGVDLKLGAFWDFPTLSALASAVDARRDSGNWDHLPKLRRMPRSGPLPLTHFQERIWKFSQTEDGHRGYVMVKRSSLSGPLNVKALRETLAYLSDRHEMLRATFEKVDGRLVQIVHVSAAPDLEEWDVSTAQDPEKEADLWLQEEGRKPFDLQRLPLMRFALVRLRAEEFWLQRTDHHIISDKWSWEIYYEELRLIYSALVRGEVPLLPRHEPLQYGDFAAWQREVYPSGGEAREKMLQWWKRHFTGVSQPAQLPFQRLQPEPNASSVGSKILMDIRADAALRLEQLRIEEHTTSYVLRIAAWAMVLAFEARHSEIILGAYVSDRPLVETQKMFGFFANLATLCFRCEDKLTFRQWLEVARHVMSETRAKLVLTYEDLCEEMRRCGIEPPEIRMIVSLMDPVETIEFADLKFKWQDAPQQTRMPWGFTLTFSQVDGQERCGATFDTRLYDPVRVAGAMRRLVHFLEAAAFRPDVPMAVLLADGAKATEEVLAAPQ